MNIPKKELSGIGKKSRRYLQRVLAVTEGVITPKRVAEILSIKILRANVLLSYWASRGWLQRIRQGAYVEISLKGASTDRALEEPWVIAEQLFSPCYITGLTAAQYWDFTEQIIEIVTVFTEKAVRRKSEEIGKVRFLFKQISREKRFGLKKIWRDNIPVYFADPSRTIVDLLADPKLGGGIVSVEEILLEYWRSEYLNRELLLDYVKKYNNKTIFKRLGFLLEKNHFEESDFLEKCRKSISKGYSQLDPSVKGRRLSKKWGLWYPEKYKTK